MVDGDPHDESSLQSVTFQVIYHVYCLSFNFEDAVKTRTLKMWDEWDENPKELHGVTEEMTY